MSHMLSARKVAKSWVFMTRSQSSCIALAWPRYINMINWQNYGWNLITKLSLSLHPRLGVVLEGCDLVIIIVRSAVLLLDISNNFSFNNYSGISATVIPPISPPDEDLRHFSACGNSQKTTGAGENCGPGFIIYLGSIFLTRNHYLSKLPVGREIQKFPPKPKISPKIPLNYFLKTTHKKGKISTL